MNKLHPASPNPESVTRAVIKSFAEDRPVAHAVKASGLSKRQVVDLYGRLRERIAAHSNELIAKHEKSEHWTRARDAYRTTAQRYVGVKLARLDRKTVDGSIRVGKRFDADDPLAVRARDAIRANPDEFNEVVEAQITKFLDGAKELYIKFRVATRRGIAGSARELHGREAAYRYSLLMMKNAAWQSKAEATVRTFSDGTRAYTRSKNLLVVLFARGHTIGREVENDLIRILEQEPL